MLEDWIDVSGLAFQRVRPATNCLDGGIVAEWHSNSLAYMSLILLRMPTNLGFAGGNNAAIRLALERDDFKYVWILNNDTVVDESALNRLVEKSESNSLFGICGSTLVDFESRLTVQARGGVFNRWLARTRDLGAGEDRQTPVNEDEYAQRMDYVVGASLLVSCRFLNDIGLIAEDYFLYFEELDWLSRSRGKYILGYAARSIVYHKGGASTGANSTRKSHVGEYYGTRARITFTRKFNPYAMPTVFIAILISLLRQLIKANFDVARTIWSGAMDGLLGRTGARRPR